ncbi:MAG: ligase-associated DNA damage response endonuclease PdeM [Bacteroidia bacterium]
MEVQIGQEIYNLLSEKAIFRIKDSTLIIADLHLGKAQHFRKNGISIPPISAQKDYEILKRLILKYNPLRIILLGDLFHSSHNVEWTIFCDFVNAFKHIEFVLILGNHDILEIHHYKSVCLTLIENTLEEGDLILSHYPLQNFPSDKINIAGHIHPGIALYGKGKQRLQLPCFYFYKNQFILPAFGSLTGLQLIGRTKETSVYVIAENKVIEI